MDAKAWCEYGAALVADGLDEMGLQDQVLSPQLRWVREGPSSAFFGPARTLCLRALPADAEPPRPTREQMAGRLAQVEALAQPGVVVVIGFEGEAPEFGVFGELLANTFKTRGAVALVTDSYVRDIALLSKLELGVIARGACARNALGRFQFVSFGEPVEVGGVTIGEGDYVYGDGDGAVLVPAEVVASGHLLSWLEEASQQEGRTLEAVRSGEKLSEVFLREGRL